MQQKKSINFGFRGWMLIIFQAIGFLAFTAFTNYPMNLLAPEGFYGGMTPEGKGTSVVATVYTVAAVVTIVIQLILSRFMSRIKNMKRIALVLGAIALCLAAFITFYPPTMTPEANWLWLILYGLCYISITMYSTFAIGVLIGQWFPRRKGTVMGIATLMFPIANALIGPVATSIFTVDLANQPIMPNIIKLGLGIPGGSNTFMTAMIPFLAVSIIGWLIGLIFVKDYPEQCGCFRDNDKSITPEVAQAMMEQEIKARETTVWKTGHTLMSRDFWFITIPAGVLLMFAVGAMTQTQSIFKNVGFSDAEYTNIMLGVAAAGLVGSFVLGVIDTKIGTKKSMIIAMCLMIISAVIGFAGASSYKSAAAAPVEATEEVVQEAAEAAPEAAEVVAEEAETVKAAAADAEKAVDEAAADAEKAVEEAAADAEKAVDEAAAAPADAAAAAADEAGESAGEAAEGESAEGESAEGESSGEFAGAPAEEEKPMAPPNTGSYLVLIAFIILGLFMGASSNYTVSAAAQYWRREDFSSVFAVLNAIANLIQAFGPMLIATLVLGSAGVSGVFIACGIGGVLSLILMILFSPKNVKATDDKYRTAAGKPLDDELAHRL